MGRESPLTAKFKRAACCLTVSQSQLCSGYEPPPALIPLNKPALTSTETTPGLELDKVPPPVTIQAILCVPLPFPCPALLAFAKFDGRGENWAHQHVLNDSATAVPLEMGSGDFSTFSTVQRKGDHGCPFLVKQHLQLPSTKRAPGRSRQVCWVTLLSGFFSHQCAILFQSLQATSVCP